jgi:beta-N-acetylhexosaminidase
MIHYGLAAVMPAHVVFPQVDGRPAGYSKIWLQRILRNQMGFQGAIFSDDLSMEAAGVAGDYAERALTALEAGCDMVLVCNHTEATIQVLERLGDYSNPASQIRLVRMHGRGGYGMAELRVSSEWQQAVDQLAAIDQGPWLEMNV